MDIMIPIIYFVLVLAHAKYHAYLIVKKNKTIKSYQKVVEWGLASAICFFLLLKYSGWLPLVILPIVTRLAFFDTALNLFRKKNWLYEKASGGVDGFEKKIGLPTWAFRLIYFAMYIVYLITYFNA
jgi:hypothetical protein